MQSRSSMREWQLAVCKVLFTSTRNVIPCSIQIRHLQVLYYSIKCTLYVIFNNRYDLYHSMRGLS